MSDYPKSYTHNNPRPEECKPSDERFPIIKQLKLELVAAEWSPKKLFILAEDLERILEKAPMVAGWEHKAGYLYEGQKFDQEPHWQGLIVARRPLVRDTADGLLRELIASWGSSIKSRDDIIERAKKLVEKT